MAVCWAPLWTSSMPESVWSMAAEGVVLDGHPGVGAMGEGVDGHGLEVAGLDEIVEGLGGLLLSTV